MRSTDRAVRSLLLCCALILGVAASGGVAAADTPPTISGPLGGNPSIESTTTFDLASAGYRQAEYFLTGTAHSFSASELSSDGRWTAREASEQPYVTRLVVYRPIDARKFNGAVYVEWMNVTNGIGDSAVEWKFLHNELMRQGAVWIGVSAQAIGVNGAKKANAARYEKLQHPGDSYSYDIYDQVGAVLKTDAKRVLQGLVPKRLIAVGESQSASRMVTYINAIHPVRRTYQGFLVHSRGASAAALSQAPLADIKAPSQVMIRDDVGVPVFVFQSETDVLSSKGTVRQPDGTFFRTWELPGSSHVDIYELSVAGSPDERKPGYLAQAMTDSLVSPLNSTRLGKCAAPLNGGPHMWVASAAAHYLNAWLAEGKQPPKSPKIETLGSGATFQLVTDERGNVKGGIRTPYLDAPVATLSGAPATGSSATADRFCALMGTTQPFTEARMAELYGNRSEFIRAWNKSIDEAVSSGFILAADVKTLRAVGRRLAGEKMRSR